MVMLAVTSRPDLDHIRQMSAEPFAFEGWVHLICSRSGKLASATFCSAFLGCQLVVSSGFLNEAESTQKSVSKAF